MESAALNLRGVDRPEIVIGLVGALGCPMKRVAEILGEEFVRAGYAAETLRLSDFLEAYSNLSNAPPNSSARAAVRTAALMNRGNELRERFGSGDALAMHVAAHIRQLRPEGADQLSLPERAFVLHQLKHPEEVRLLRQVYGDAFHLLGIYAPLSVRRGQLRNVLSMSDEEADGLLERDAGEEIRFGQKVTQTFHLSDFFITHMGSDNQHFENVRDQVRRYLELLFGMSMHSPTMDEYGMFLANSAALRSVDLSRQVGAALMRPSGEILSLGCNEVPRAGGGQYWTEQPPDERDFVRGVDSNDQIKRESLDELIRVLRPDINGLNESERAKGIEEISEQLRGTRFMNLTEYGRAVHAEMEAILSAGRIGVSVVGATLYTTTFPCHNCAKHIVGSGIQRVVYVEPYSKSLADRLHHDAIAFGLLGDGPSDGKVSIEPFKGVAPRVFPRLFSAIEPDGKRIERKTADGSVRTEPIGLRMASSPLTHIDRESMVALYLFDFMNNLANSNESGK